MGEGSVSQDKIEDAIRRSETAVVWGRGSKHVAQADHSFKELIRGGLETLKQRMEWRSRLALRKRFEPIEDLLGERSKDFYWSFDELYKGRISIVASGPRTEHPFMLFLDEDSYVAGLSDASQDTLFYGYGFLEIWRADPRVHFIEGRGIPSFDMLFGASLAYLLALYAGAGLSSARQIQSIFDPENRLQSSLEEMLRLTKKGVWPGSQQVQRKAAVALRGYLSAWFDFMEKSSWLEIHRTLRDTRVAEREQSFLDTATTEISETARGIILDEMVNAVFSAEEMERRDRERREKEMDWTMFRIALGILYPREKTVIRSVWERSKRRLTWKQLEEIYYEEIWDLMRSHLAGEVLEERIREKDRTSLGRWHFIFELKRSERPREKVRTLRRMGLEELFGRKNKVLSLLTWEGYGLPIDAGWEDIIARFRKIIIRYHPDRAEITGIDLDEARKVSSAAIQNFRELEIIHDLQPEIFGIDRLPADPFAVRKS